MKEEWEPPNAGGPEAGHRTDEGPAVGVRVRDLQVSRLSAYALSPSCDSEVTDIYGGFPAETR